MNRILFKTKIIKEKAPLWPCPTCNVGQLKILEGTFSRKESKESRQQHGEDHWEPEFIEYTYCCLLRCANDNCLEIVSSVGSGFVDFDIRYDHENLPFQEYYDVFSPLFFHPALKLIDIPEKTPDEVQNLLNESFSMFFSSPSSAANQLRKAVEKILNTLKIPRYRNSKGKRRAISLHERIASLPSKYDEIKSFLLAIKWLGNAGSHSTDKLTTDDVLDAYELMEHGLQLIYDGDRERVKKLATQINKRKGITKS